MKGNLEINQLPGKKIHYHCQYQPRVLNLEFSPDTITANLEDGRRLSIPTTWFERIRKADLSQLKNYRILPDGYHIYWPEIDEDLSLRVFTDGLGTGCC